MFGIVADYVGKTLALVSTFLLLIFVTRFFVIDIGQVNGQSMEPTFGSQKLFVVNKGIYLVREPKRGDVVQLFDPTRPEVLLLKRIIGLPGETVSIKRNAVYILNSQGFEFRLAEDYLSPDTITRVEVGQDHSITAPLDSYVVLGDNRLHSVDSRAFGPVHRRLIAGYVPTF